MLRPILRPLVRAGSGAVVATLALCVATSALADVDLEIVGKAKIKGTFGEAGGEELIRFQGTKGTKIKVVLKAKGKSALDPGLRVLRSDQEVQLGDALQDKGRKVQVKNPELGDTDLYTLEIQGDTAGEYLLKVVLKPAKKVKETLQVGAQTAQVTLPVPSGSKLILLAKSSKKSGVTPRIQDLDGLDLSAEGKLTGNKHKVVLGDVGAGGDMTLTVGSEDGTEGEVQLIAKIKPPKPQRGAIDLTDVALGATNGDGLVFGKEIQPTVGGELTVEDDPILGGTSIDVPANSLPSSTVISIRSSAQIEFDQAQDNAAAGPTIDFQPSGLAFQKAATITLPFDVSQVPEGVDPQTALRVLVVEDDGTERLVTPASVDLENGTVELPVSGFTRFTVVAPLGPPNLNGRSYWGILFDFFHEPDFSGSDQSGTRVVFASLSTFDFAPSGGMVNIFGFERELRFGLQNGPGTPFGVYEFETFNETDVGDWFLGTSGSHVFIDDDVEGPSDKYAIGRGGSVLMLPVNDFPNGDDEAPILDLLLERPNPQAVEGFLPGTYHFLEGSLFVPEPPVTGGFVSPELVRSQGTITFLPDGVARITGHSREFIARQNGDVIERSEDDQALDETATWFVEPSGNFPGSVVLGVGGDSLRLLPDKTGRAFVGSQIESAGPDEFTYLLGVRSSSALSRNDVVGTYEFGAIGLELATYTRPNGPQTTEFADVNAFGDVGLFEFDGSSRFEIMGKRELFVFRDPSQPGGVRVFDEPVETGETQRLGLTVRSDGSIVVQGDDRFVGAISSDRVIGFALPDPKQGGGESELHVVVFLRKPASAEQFGGEQFGGESPGGGLIFNE